MGIRINTNVSAINTRRHLQKSSAAYGEQMEKVSSGPGIDRAGDDVAGLAISEGLKADIRALNQASRYAAGTSMGEIDAAMEAVITARGNIGALQNRLETSIRNIKMTSENPSVANSRIRDVDVAHETSKMTSFQILQQAGVSMLSSANMTTGLAMALLT